VVSESQRRLIEAQYGQVDNGKLVRCAADPDINNGEPPVVFTAEWLAKAAAGKFAFLAYPEWVPYRCPLVTEEHYHLCQPGLQVACPRCGADPGMVCFAVERAPSEGVPEQRAEPHPERLEQAKKHHTDNAVRDG
jgi:hypothetical protein